MTHSVSIMILLKPELYVTTIQYLFKLYKKIKTISIKNLIRYLKSFHQDESFDILKYNLQLDTKMKLGLNHPN